MWGSHWGKEKGKIRREGKVAGREEDRPEPEDLSFERQKSRIPVLPFLVIFPAGMWTHAPSLTSPSPVPSPSHPCIASCDPPGLVPLDPSSGASRLPPAGRVSLSPAFAFRAPTATHLGPTSHPPCPPPPPSARLGVSSQNSGGSRCTALSPGLGSRSPSSRAPPRAATLEKWDRVHSGGHPGAVDGAPVSLPPRLSG